MDLKKNKYYKSSDNGNGTSKKINTKKIKLKNKLGDAIRRLLKKVNAHQHQAAV